MKKMRWMPAILTMVAICTAGPSRAADAPDPVLGTWTLNLAKSRFNPGPGPKAQTRTYEAVGDSVHLILTGVAPDGKPVSTEWTFRYDGKAYPMADSAEYDASSLKRIDTNTVKSIMLKGGKQVAVTIRTVSADGKVLTFSTKGTDVNGKHYERYGVFEKQ